MSSNRKMFTIASSMPREKLMWWALNVAASFPGKFLKNRQTPGNAWKTREKLWNGLEHVSRSYLKMFVDFGASQSMHIFCSRQSVVIVRTSRGGNLSLGR